MNAYITLCQVLRGIPTHQRKAVVHVPALEKFLVKAAGRYRKQRGKYSKQINKQKCSEKSKMDQCGWNCFGRLLRIDGN